MKPHTAARRVLVVAPHPDDEVIGAWGLMERLGRAGARIDVLVVSDGSASHPGSRSWPVARLVPTRRRETLRAMRTLGVPPNRVRFLGLPDGRLSDTSSLDRAIGQAVRRMPPPDLIVAPVADDAHADHRAVARALERLPRHGETRWGYQVWPEDVRRSARRRVSLNGYRLCRKRQAIRCHRTQLGLITDADAGFAMTHRHLRAFVRPAECFRVLA